jgi:phage shock protein A
MNVPNQGKSFFQRPEGNLGLFVIIAGVMLGGTALFYMLPTIIVLLQNTLHAIFLGGAVFVIATVLMNNQFRTAMWNIFKSSMRALTGLVIAVDPIGILENYLLDMKDKIAELSSHVATVRGKKETLKRNIREQKEKAENHAQRIKHFQAKGDDMNVTQNKHQLGFVMQTIQKLEETEKMSSNMLDTLDEMRKRVTMMFNVTETMVDQKKIEYDVIKAAHKAMSGVKKIMMGDEKRDMFEDSLRYIADDIGDKLGAIDDFMVDGADFIANFDADQAGITASGDDFFKKWESTGSFALDTLSDVEGKLGDLREAPVTTSSTSTGSYLN